jgi:hypothetical protein
VTIILSGITTVEQFSIDYKGRFWANTQVRPYWFLAEDHSKETIKMVKARGYELLPATRLKSGVVLRGFGLTIGISV